MKFRADEISSVIQREIEQFSPEITRSEVGQVLEVGDGIARVYGLSGLMAGEMVEFENGVKGIALNLEESSVGVMVLGDYTRIEEGDSVTATGAVAPGARRRGDDRPRRQPPGRADRRPGADPDRQDLAARIDRPGHRRAAAGRRAASDRHQVDRRHDADRPRPARADHRRPQDRQDGHRDRHDPQPEGDRASSAFTWRSPRRNRPPPPWSTSSAATAPWTTRSWSPPAPATRPRCSTSPLTPAAPWPSTSCTSKASRPW